MLNIVTLQAGLPVSTSLAISHGTELDHASVIKLVRTYLSDLEEFGAIGFEIQKGKALLHGGFAKATEYAILNEHQATLLLTYMRNNEIVRTFKKALVKAFYELRQVPVVDPMAMLNDPAAMRAMLLGYTEKVIKLESTVKELEPKAEALDLFATGTEGSFCLRDAAKTLQTKEKNFIQLLVEKHWIYRRPLGIGWLAYSDKLQSGLMEHKVSTGTRKDGSEWVNTQARITAKGLAKLAQIFTMSGVAA